jgi:hypothetical protein
MNEDDEKRHQDEEVLDTVAPLGDEDLTVDDRQAEDVKGGYTAPGLAKHALE